MVFCSFFNLCYVVVVLFLKDLDVNFTCCYYSSIEETNIFGGEEGLEVFGVGVLFCFFFYCLSLQGQV